MAKRMSMGATVLGLSIGIARGAATAQDVHRTSVQTASAFHGIFTEDTDVQHVEERFQLGLGDASDDDGGNASRGAVRIDAGSDGHARESLLREQTWPSAATAAQRSASLRPSSASRRSRSQSSSTTPNT
jgi:hypothetical protein